MREVQHLLVAKDEFQLKRRVAESGAGIIRHREAVF
jgi:hypothetical protein